MLKTTTDSFFEPPYKNTEPALQSHDRLVQNYQTEETGACFAKANFPALLFMHCLAQKVHIQNDPLQKKAKPDLQFCFTKTSLLTLLFINNLNKRVSM